MFNIKTKIGNSNLSYEVAVKPADLNTVDQVVSAKHASLYVPETGAFETTNGFKYGSPTFSAIRLWATVRFFKQYTKTSPFPFTKYL